MRLFIMLFFVSICNSFRNNVLIRPLRMQIKMKQSKVPKEKNMAPLYLPRTQSQKKYLKSMNDPKNQLIFGIGPAGTGKTLFACSYAVDQMKSGNAKKIIMTRPIVPVEEDLGFLPGKLNSKMEPWVRPIFDILEEYYSRRDITTMLQSGTIEIAPLGYMRGRTFKNAIVIADEMQNSTPNQMLMVTTRIGDNSKLLITGDLDQSDRLENNGLKEIMEKIESYKGKKNNIQICKFTKSDIQRSEIVTTVLNIYDKKPALPLPTKEEIQERDLKEESKKIKKEVIEKIQRRNDDAAIIPKEDMNRLKKYEY